MRVGDVGVYLGGGDVGVAEHLLNGADICPVLNKMRREGVPEGVRGDALKAAFLGVFLDHRMDDLTVQGAARRGDEEVLRARIFVLSAVSEVAFHPFDGGSADGDAAGLAALPGGSEDAAVEIDVADLDIDRL